ncbi:MAG: helix-turn-helix domain-containing protein [Candidatus Woesearchaeota archaeon]
MQQLFKVLSSETRLKLLKSLLKEDDFVCECELDHNLQKDRTVIYRHLRKLEDVGLIETKKDGKMIKSKVKNPKYVKRLFEISKVINDEH